LRKENPALASDAAYLKLQSSNDDQIYAFLREKNGRKVLVVLNLSDKKQNTELKGGKLEGSALNVFSGKKETLQANQSFALEPWGYYVYSY